MLKVVTPGAAMITTAQAKTHLRVTTAADDAYIDGLVLAAQQHIERELDRSLTTQTLEQRFEPAELRDARLELRRGPVRSIVEVAVIGQNNAETLVTSSLYNVSREDGIYFAYAAPTVANELAVRYTAGYDAGKVPAPIIQAAMLLVAHWYANREAVSVDANATPKELPLAVTTLLSTYQNWT